MKCHDPRSFILVALAALSVPLAPSGVVPMARGAVESAPSTDDLLAQQRLDDYQRDVEALLADHRDEQEASIADLEQALTLERASGASRSRLLKIVSRARTDARNITRSFTAELNRVHADAFLDLRRMDAPKRIVNDVGRVRSGAMRQLKLDNREALDAIAEASRRLVGA